MTQDRTPGDEKLRSRPNRGWDPSNANDFSASTKNRSAAPGSSSAIRKPILRRSSQKGDFMTSFTDVGRIVATRPNPPRGAPLRGRESDRATTGLFLDPAQSPALIHHTAATPPACRFARLRSLPRRWLWRLTPPPGLLVWQHPQCSCLNNSAWFHWCQAYRQCNEVRVVPSPLPLP
jgi:hypothetical protein